MRFRFVKEEDTQSILDIYKQYIDTTITFEYELPTYDVFLERIRSISSEYPYIVCEEEGKIIGYAYAHRYRERKAYSWNVEFSVYLDRSVTARGIGTKMYEILFDIVKLQGVKNVYSLVTYPNKPSEKLHEKMGFERLIVYKKDGFKNGEWKDVICFRKNIALYNDLPEEVKNVKAIDKHELGKILDK